MLEFKNVSKRYNQQTVLDTICLTVKEGEFFVLVGPSGSGKTTTLKMINRLIDPSEGDIYLHKKELMTYNLKELRLSIGYVLQQIALFPNLTVQENIELIPELKKWPKVKREKRVRELLTLVNLEPDKYLKRKPSELSGGEQQRVGILRAIAAKPDVILMDEPFSALDPIARQQLQELIKEIHHEIKSTIVFVTHDMKEALELGDRICIMRNGKIVQIDTPDMIQQHPENDFVAEFFKQEQSQGGVDFLGLTVADVLVKSQNPIIHQEETVSVSPELPLVELIELIQRHQIVSVVVDHQLVGTISNDDLLHFLQVELKEVTVNG
ncbi:ABC transporter ATP-binding protein [uncultured Vagococcus sp.]|uniref:ABC transporter ATP-binding protein n=1 Tax=uncultured Vagococcus sp. TaxID=189676 RepID=UPI0028D27A2C|nr:ABC transporter ATP-binding protein [uncultured Vagococcus sp.]